MDEAPKSHLDAPPVLLETDWKRTSHEIPQRKIEFE
jgi:hypothetical protein